MKKRYKKMTGICILFFGILLVTGTVSAVEYKKSVKTVTNDFTPAEINIAVQENDVSNSDSEANNTLKWEISDNTTYTATKKVTVYNNDNGSNSAPAFIRVCIVPHWTTTIDGTEVDVTNSTNIPDFEDFVTNITDNSYTMGDVTFNLNEDWATNWIYAADGYFYCRTSINPKESTPELLESVSISNKTYEYISSNGVNLRVDILADSIQTEGQDSGETSAIKERWGKPEILGITVSGDGLTEYPQKEGD